MRFSGTRAKRKIRSWLRNVGAMPYRVYAVADKLEIPSFGKSVLRRLVETDMHICHVVTGLLGGPEVIVRQLLEMQMAAGHRVSLVFSTVHGGNDRVVNDLPQGVELIRWNAGRNIAPVDDYRRCSELIGILRAMKPDVAHLHNSKAGALGRIACRYLGIRNIYSPHGPAYLRRDIGSLKRIAYYGMEWSLCLLGDQLVASSQTELDQVRHLPSVVHLVNNGVDAREIQTAAAGSPAMEPSGRFRIVLCGRIWPQKNPEFVTQLAQAAPAEWEWIWVGDGPLRSLLDANPRIHVVGWQPSQTVLATVRTADVYMQASRWEGMSFALLEAMALGRPCVVSDVTGNRDLIRNDISGYVCKSQAEYLTRLEALSKEPNLRRRLGDGAAAAADKEFSLEQAAQAWSKIYEQLNLESTSTTCPYIV